MDAGSRPCARQITELVQGFLLPEGVVAHHEDVLISYCGGVEATGAKHRTTF